MDGMLKDRQSGLTAHQKNLGCLVRTRKSAMGVGILHFNQAPPPGDSASNVQQLRSLLLQVVSPSTCLPTKLLTQGQKGSQHRPTHPPTAKAPSLLVFRVSGSS